MTDAEAGWVVVGFIMVAISCRLYHLAMQPIIAYRYNKTAKVKRARNFGIMLIVATLAASQYALTTLPVQVFVGHFVVYLGGVGYLLAQSIRGK